MREAFDDGRIVCAVIKHLIQNTGINGVDLRIVSLPVQPEQGKRQSMLFERALRSMQSSISIS